MGSLEIGGKKMKNQPLPRSWIIPIQAVLAGTVLRNGPQPKKIDKGTVLLYELEIGGKKMTND
jgi:hypothetical protein